MAKQAPVHEERLEDVFQDEIIKAFFNITSFRRFARSKDGLCLDQSVIKTIVEDHGASGEEQKMETLFKWKEIQGEKATVSEIRCLLRRYLKGDDKGEYIVLENGIFGLYKNHVLCKQAHVFLGEQTSEVTGSYICAIKLRQNNKENLREAKILSKLRNHVNVVSILHAGICRLGPIDYIYVAMELSWTNTVRNMLEDSDRLAIPFNEFISMNLVRQILRALDFIHSNHIIHRDLKPENILVSKDLSQSKVTDFGISKTITDGHSTRQTNANIGTDGYRARESYITNAKISLKSDIFSAGVTIAEISSNGKHPFGEEPLLRSYNIKNNKNLDISHLLVPQIMNLIKRMLEMDPEKRPTAVEVLNEVQQFQTSSQLKNRQTTAEQSSATSSITQLLRPTAEKVLNKVRQFQAWFKPKNQQTTADQSSATSSITQIQRPTAEEVLNEVQQFQTLSQPKNQQTTADQFSATSMTQLQRPTAEKVQQYQTSSQPKNQQTAADQFSAASSMTQLSVNDKVNAIIMFNMKDKHMYSYKPATKEYSRMQEFAIVEYMYFTTVISGKHIYILCVEKVYQLEYSDPTAKWKQVSSMSEYHGDHPPAFVLNGSIYVCGKSDPAGTTKSVERYDVASDRWHRICNMNIERRDSCIVATKDHIYCMGGFDERRNDLQSVERFDEKLNKWEIVEPLPETIYSDASAAAVKNRIYVIGYHGVLCYNIQNDSWTEINLSKQWHFKKYYAVKILAVNEELYLIGKCSKKRSLVHRIYLLEPETSRMPFVKEIDDKRDYKIEASLAVKL